MYLKKMELVFFKNLRMKHTCPVAIALFLFIPYFTQAQSVHGKPSAIIAKGAAVIKTGSGYSFTEGPAVDSDGNVFFTGADL